MFDAMEEIIRQYPDQWEMFRQFWPQDDAPALTSATSESHMPAMGEVAEVAEAAQAAASLASGEHAND
jgi:hypothetical protein